MITNLHDASSDSVHWFKFLLCEADILNKSVDPVFNLQKKTF